MKPKRIILFIILWGLIYNLSMAQIIENTVAERLQNYFVSYIAPSSPIGRCQLDSFSIDNMNRAINIYPSPNFAYQSFTEEKIKAIEKYLSLILPGPVNYYKHAIIVDGVNIKAMVPNLYRKLLPIDHTRLNTQKKEKATWVRPLSRPIQVTEGLKGKYIALSPPSLPNSNPSYFCTNESLYIASCVSSYLIPMLENAGAIVYTPFKRNSKRQSILVNNHQYKKNRSVYVEQKSKKAHWFTQNSRLGNFRFTRTEKRPDKAYAGWIPQLPETGKYAVYVRYPLLTENVSDAKYIILHQGGRTEVKVNQQIGGNTWTYLGTYPFQKGRKNTNMVLLSNQSYEKGIICADAVCFGNPPLSKQEKNIKLPIELNLTLQSKPCKTTSNNSMSSCASYANTLASRDLADILLTGLKKDLSATFNIDWKKGILKNNKDLSQPKATTPFVNLTLLDYSNFQDMLLGHNPNFKFNACRSIYKSIVRYVAAQHQKTYTIQPLPITHFQIRQSEREHYITLKWQPTQDLQEPTATPKRYVVYTRIASSGFDNGTPTTSTSCNIKIQPGYIYSFKITAANEGGESFPSEILSAYIAPSINSNGKTVLIVNGFDRLSGPAVIDTAQQVGFDLQTTPGLPRTSTCAYSGGQKVFNSSAPKHKGKLSLGYSTQDLAGIEIAGNTFDYTYLHGKAIQEAGKYSFVSCSDEAVEVGQINLEQYYMVDYILGMEHESKAPYNKKKKLPYKTFSLAMQKALRNYCQQGGNLFASGAFIGRDMQNNNKEKTFTRDVLKFDYQASIHNTFSGEIEGLNRRFTVPQGINEESYAVSSVDCITPSGNAFSVFAYDGNHYSAGIAYPGNDYRTFILGFPFESINSLNDRTYIMMGILDFFNQRNHKYSPLK